MEVFKVLVFAAFLSNVVTASDLARDLDRIDRELSARATSDSSPGRACETQHGTYAHNQRIPNSDPCATCHCHEGNQMCMMVMCAYPMCVDRNMNPDVCCDACPTGDNCWLDGEIIDAGEPVIQQEGRCTRYCSCPRSMQMYRRYQENTFAHCIVVCDDENSESQQSPGVADDSTGPAIGHGQMEEELPFPEMFNTQGK